MNIKCLTECTRIVRATAWKFQMFTYLRLNFNGSFPSQIDNFIALLPPQQILSSGAWLTAVKAVGMKYSPFGEDGNGDVLPENQLTSDTISSRMLPCSTSAFLQAEMLQNDGITSF